MHSSGDVGRRTPAAEHALADGPLLPEFAGPIPQAVLIQPGATQLTRTFGASDLARLRVNAITAPFVAENSSPLSPSMPTSA